MRQAPWTLMGSRPTLSRSRMERRNARLASRTMKVGAASGTYVPAITQTSTRWPPTAGFTRPVLLAEARDGERAAMGELDENHKCANMLVAVARSPLKLQSVYLRKRL